MNICCMRTICDCLILCSIHVTDICQSSACVLLAHTLVALSQGLICAISVHLGLSEVVFIEGCPHVRGGLYEGFHCSIHIRIQLLSESN